MDKGPTSVGGNLEQVNFLSSTLMISKIMFSFLSTYFDTVMKV